ncbi:MAG: TetR/AcrR family transcriptional regulator [Myxococcaceae bacterium]
MPYRATAYTNQRKAEVREAIIDATVRLLREGGYRAAGIDEIAARAGIASGSIYRHFDTKAALFSEVFRLLSGREVDAIAKALEGEGPIADRLVGAAEVFARRALKGRKVAYALIAEPVDVAVDEERLIYRRAYAKTFARAIREGVANGELPLQDPELTAAAMVGALGEVLLGPLSVGSKTKDEATVAKVAAFCRRAIGGDGK